MCSTHNDCLSILTMATVDVEGQLLITLAFFRKRGMFVSMRQLPPALLAAWQWAKRRARRSRTGK